MSEKRTVASTLSGSTSGSVPATTSARKLSSSANTELLLAK